MRRVKIIERAGEIYPYAAVDQQTGEVPLRLSDRAALVALCHRLGWAVDEETDREGVSYHQRTDDHRRARRCGGARRRVGGASSFTSERKRKRVRGLEAHSTRAALITRTQARGGKMKAPQ
jgi:hypothetical protein